MHSAAANDCDGHGAGRGTNYQLGDHYREFLAKSGIELELDADGGKPRKSGSCFATQTRVSVALVQGGAMSGVESSGVESWVRLVTSCQAGSTAMLAELAAAGRLTGSIGPEGSGRQSLRVLTY